MPCDGLVNSTRAANDPWIPVGEAAARLGVPATAIRRWIEDPFLREMYQLARRDGETILVNLRSLENVIEDNKIQAYVTMAEAAEVIAVPQSTILGWIEARALRAWKFRGWYRPTVKDLRETYDRQQTASANVTQSLALLSFLATLVSILLDHAGVDLQWMVIVLTLNGVWLMCMNWRSARAWVRSRSTRAIQSAVGAFVLTFLAVLWHLRSMKGGQRRRGNEGLPISATPTAAATGLPPLVVTVVVIPLQVLLLVLTALAPFGAGPFWDGEGTPPDPSSAFLSAPIGSVTAPGPASPQQPIPGSPSLPASQPPDSSTAPQTPPAVQAPASPTTVVTSTLAVCQAPPSSLSQPPDLLYPRDGQPLDYEGSYHFAVSPVQGADGYWWQVQQSGNVVVDNVRDEGHPNPGTTYSTGAGAGFAPGPVEVAVRAQVCGSWTPPGTITIDLVPTGVAAPPSNTAVPPPDECRVSPRTVESLLELGYGQPIAEPAAHPAPEGVPADEATIASVTATVRELIACVNAGDRLRAFALFTDQGLHQAFFPGGPPSQEEIDSLAAPPTPTTPEEQEAMPLVQDVQLLPDGRARALLVGGGPAMAVDGDGDRIYIFVRAGDRWLIDEQFVLAE
ncbi:MAG: hypothetical protein M3P51_18345 [Chloroflexota bacterium]|nr:hypothetical protein [Chloroflexota bacterium]